MHFYFIGIKGFVLLCSNVVGWKCRLWCNVLFIVRCWVDRFTKLKNIWYIKFLCTLFSLQQFFCLSYSCENEAHIKSAHHHIHTTPSHSHTFITSHTPPSHPHTHTHTHTHTQPGWLVDSNARPSFKQLVDLFKHMASDPSRYVVIEVSWGYFRIRRWKAFEVEEH